jgi:signal transduction histidine kinase
MALIILQSESFNDVLTIVVTDITKHNELLDIEIKEKFKSKVINSFSHELRTPLNGALLYLYSFMNDESINCETKQTYVLPAINALKLQCYLINDIVDFSALNEGIFELKI